MLRTIQRYTQTFDYAWRAAILREASSYYGSDAEGKKVLAAEHRSWRRRAVERQARPSRQPARAPSFRLLPAERQLPAE